MQKPILEMKVRDFMTDASKIKAVRKNDTLEKVIPLLIDTGINHVAVFDGKNFEGFFGYKQLARLYRRPIHQTQVGAYVIKPPEFSKDAGIVDAAEAMYRLNYKILPVIEDKKLIGVLSERDVLRAAMAAGVLKGRKVGEFMTPSPITIKDTDRLGAAISIIRDKNISRLPVIDASGRIAGMFESTEVMREMYTNESTYGINRAASMNPAKGGISVESYASDEIPAYKIAVKSLIKRLPATSKQGDSIDSAFKDILAQNMTTIIVTDERSRPVGIVVPKDILQHIALLKQKESVYIQISGLESIDSISDFQKDEVQRMIGDAVQKLGKMVPMQFFTMHYKVHHAADAKQSKFSIRCKLGRYMVMDYGWDIIDATSRALGAFERLIITKEQKMRTKMRERGAERKSANQV